MQRDPGKSKKRLASNELKYNKNRAVTNLETRVLGQLRKVVSS